MIYKWKTGTRCSVSAETAAEVMNGLAAQNNLTAKALVDVSRPEDAPLHGEFEWDNDVAAEKYREEQGRLLIRQLVVIPEDHPEQEPVRAYFKVVEDQPTYDPIETIFQHQDKTERLFHIAMGELQAFRRKYSGIQKFAKLFSVIDDLSA